MVTVIEEIVSAGCVVSTVNVLVAGVASLFPAWSTARTENVCTPSERLPVVCGDVQADHSPASRRHRNVDPSSEDVKRNVGVGSSMWDPSAGPAVIVVSGGVVST
jgi:hypothetical protein